MGEQDAKELDETLTPDSSTVILPDPPPAPTPARSTQKRDRRLRGLAQHEAERGERMHALLPSERFLVERELGQGGMGVVLEAIDRPLGRRVAVKVLRPGVHESATHLERFQIEARAAARLRHPNVVTVHEVGELDGRPYLIMDLIEGESLAERLRRQRTLDPREAAEIVRSVAGALHYAHGHAVLHRDIKPGNILLAKDGQALLSDFGLAKMVGSGAESPTASGEVMGTPAFMAPEQAAGELERVDRRSDVYSLGATLYCCLVGHPPFTEAQLPMLLRAVAEREPPPPSRLRPGLDRDLETICLRCLEKDPAARYGSAQELADELRRWLRHEPILARRPGPLERLSKWRRRNRAVARTMGGALVLGGVLVLVGSVLFAGRLRGERDLARQASERATAREQIARETLQFLVGQVEEQLADLPGKKAREVRGHLLERALEKLVALQRTQDADAPISVEANDAWRQIADLAVQAGSWTRAEEAFGQAERIARDLLARGPSPAVELRLALALNGQARVAEEQGQLPRALSAYEESLGLLRGLIARDPREERYRGALVQTLNGLGTLHRARRDLTACLSAYEQALGTARELGRKDLITISLNGLGHARLERGDAAGAASAFQESLTLARERRKAEPEGQEARRWLCSALDMLANARRFQGELASAEEMAQESLQLRLAQLREDPDSATARDDLAIAHERLGELQRQRGRSQEARASHQESVALRRRLVQDDPTHANRLGLARELLEVARISRQLGEVKSAASAGDEALALGKALLEEAPADRSPVGALVRALAEQGERRAAAGDKVGALAPYLESLVLARAELARDPTNASIRQDMVVTLDRVGGMLLATGKLAEARTTFEEALSVSRTMVRDDPGNAQCVEGMANALHTLGQVQQAQGEIEAALASYADSERTYQELLAKTPRNVDPRRALAIVQGRIGTIAQAKGDLGGAVEGLSRSRKTLEALLELDPGHALARRDLSVTLYMTGELLREAGDLPGALERLEAAVKNHEVLVQQAPQYQPELDQIAEVARQVAERHALLAGARPPASPSERCLLAAARHQAGEFAQALELWAQAFEDASIRTDLSRAHLYNGACSAARAGEPERALAWLREDLERRRELLAQLDEQAKGDLPPARRERLQTTRQALLQHEAHARQDPDLESLRALEGWQALFPPG